MKEYSWYMPISHGLSPYKGLRKNFPYLQTCHNMQVGKDRLEEYTSLVDPINYPTPRGIWEADWPFPQLFRLNSMNLLVARNTVWSLDETYTPASYQFASASTVEKWSVADYHSFVLMCDGTYTYKRNPSTGVWSSADTLHAGCICDFSGQVIMGNHSTLATNTVAWSEIGNARFEIGTSDVTSGWIAMEWPGTVWDVRKLGSGVLVCGSGGISGLRPAFEPVVTYAMRKLANFGIASPHAVAGDEDKCLVVSESGRLYMVNQEYSKKDLGFGIQEIGFEEHINNLTLANVVVTHDPLSDSFYISDGTACYLLTKHGLSTVYQCPSSLTVSDGAPVGTLVETTDTGITLTTESTDMFIRAIKCLSAVEIDALGSGFKLSMYARTIQAGTTYGLTGLTPNPQSIITNKLSGMDFWFSLTNSGLAGKSVNGLTIRYKLTDKRFARSLYAGQVAAGTDSG